MPFKHKLACRLALLRDRGLIALAALLAVAIVVGCEPVPAPPPGTGVVLVGAGDIAGCSQGDDEATAKLLERMRGTVFAVGDNAYPDGTDANFSQCYDPTWGRHTARTRPSPGNPGYDTAEAGGYHRYFGANAGPAGQGDDSYDLGDWQVVSVNSEIAVSGGSVQEQWLRVDLAANPRACTLGYWHQVAGGTYRDWGNGTCR